MVFLLAFEYVVDGDEHLAGDGGDGFLVSAVVSVWMVSSRLCSCFRFTSRTIRSVGGSWRFRNHSRPCLPHRSLY